MVNRDTLGRSFTLDKVENEKANAFVEKHAGCRSHAAMGDKFSYSFYPGGVGTAIVIRCIICGKEENITNFEHW